VQIHMEGPKEKKPLVKAREGRELNGIHQVWGVGRSPRGGVEGRAGRAIFVGVGGCRGVCRGGFRGAHLTGLYWRVMVVANKNVDKAEGKVVVNQSLK